jgi:hypothetical protein
MCDLFTILAVNEEEFKSFAYNGPPECCKLYLKI